MTQQPGQGWPQEDPYAPGGQPPGYPQQGHPQQQGYPQAPAYQAAPPAYGGYATAGYATGHAQPLPPLAHWGKRVAASLLDGLIAMPFPILGLIFFGVSFRAVGTDALGREVAEPTAAGVAALVLGYAVGIGFQIWNRWLRQGRTGRSLGKQAMGITLVSEQTMAPIGGGMAFVRDICHVADGFFYVGYLWPLWDPKRQTFADKILSTIVLDG